MPCRLSIAILLLPALLAAQAKSPEPAGRSEWFATLHHTISGDEGGELVHGDFAFRNPRATAIEWRNFEASCACSHLEVTVGSHRYWLKPKPRELVELVPKGDGEEVERRPVDAIPVPAGAEGTVEVHVDLHGRPGKKAVSVDIHSTDTAEPQVRLHLEIARAESIVITPPSIDLGMLAPTEQREFTFEVRCPSQKDFKIEIPGELPAGFTIEPTKVVEKGLTVWKVRGTYGPNPSGRGQGGTLKFATDVAAMSSFSVRIDAEVALPVAVTPGFLPIGRVDPAAGATAKVVLHANDGSDLNVLSVELAGVSPKTVALETRVTKSGKDVVVEIVVPKGVPRGLLKGELQVELDHANAPQHKVLFNAFVR
ncbi:MAG: hypothetical protein KDE27_04435 [Planctomycetes bacterium]|nr:hypothetical protein [Planctomycetota bacterium]